MGDFFKPWRRKAGFVTLAMASMLNALYLLQIAFSGGRRFIPDEEERLREEVIFGFVRNAELITACLLTILSAYLLLSTSRIAKPKTNAESKISE
jgi:hypothetical protein